MKKILFLSASDLRLKKSGGSQVSDRNYKLLKEYGDVDLIYLSREINKDTHKNNEYIYKSTKNKIHTFFSNLFLYSGYLTFLSEKKILEVIKKKKYEIVFIDTSNYGRIARKIKKINSEIKIITFFHNIECDYVKERIKVEGYLYIPQLISSSYNEKKSIKYSDYLITLNSRDSIRMLKQYKRKSDLELPISFSDNYKLEEHKNTKEIEEKIYLFIGSLFYANYNGIKWFIENVMPNVSGKLLIVGKNFELKRDELNRKNVEIIGTVDNLEKYYKIADIVIAPIFDGAGMKVKTAEALMYGKKIFGTTEAFEGYEVDYNRVGKLCNTKEEFISALNNYNKTENKFNEYSRNIYLKNYSFESSKNKMKIIFEKKL